MLVELLLRFAIGGAIVCAFSVLSDVFKPKTFAGLFGAAPTIALTSLGVGYLTHGDGEVGTLARSMMLGALAFYVYGATCVTIIKREHWPVWLSAAGAWLAWFAVAFGLWGVGHAAQVLR